MKLTLQLSCLVPLIVFPAFGGSVPLQNATATYSQTYFASFSVAGTINGGGPGWAVFNGDFFGGTTAPQTAVWETSYNVGSSVRSQIMFRLEQQWNNPGQHTLGRFRLSATTDDRSQFADGLATGGDVSATWTALRPLSATSTGGATLTTLGDDSVLASSLSPVIDTYYVVVETGLQGITGFRLEAMADDSLPALGPGRQQENGNFVLTGFSADIWAVPEPPAISLIALTGLGFCCMVARNRRRG